MSQRLIITPHGLRLYSQTLKILEETKARREQALRNLTPEDVVKMMHSLGAVMVGTHRTSRAEIGHPSAPPDQTNGVESILPTITARLKS